MAGEALCRSVADGVRLAVRLQPGAGADRIDGLDSDAEGRPRIRARVTAAPEKGKANKALTRMLAKAWGVAPGTLEVVAGATARDKTLLVRGEPAVLVARIEAWAKDLNT